MWGTNYISPYNSFHGRKFICKLYRNLIEDTSNPMNFFAVK